MSNSAHTGNDDLDFIMLCLKHSNEKPKPNFDEIAKITNAKNSRACYLRHWGILKKYGMTGSKKVAGASPASPATPLATTTQGKKRRRPAAAKTTKLIQKTMASTEEEDEKEIPSKKRVKYQKATVEDAEEDTEIK